MLKKDDSELFFKDEYHSELFYKFLSRFNVSCIRISPEYGAFSYLVSATYREGFLKYCTTDGIEIEKVREQMNNYPNSEKTLIRLALHFYDAALENITLTEALYDLDEAGANVVLQSTKIRFGLLRK